VGKFGAILSQLRVDAVERQAAMLEEYSQAAARGGGGGGAAAHAAPRPPGPEGTG
jgi:hypothetical protein